MSDINLPKIGALAIAGFTLTSLLGYFSAFIITDIGLIFFDLSNAIFLLFFLITLLLFLVVNSIVDIVVVDSLYNAIAKGIFVLGFLLTTISQYPKTAGPIPIYLIYIFFFLALLITKNTAYKQYTNLIKPQIGYIVSSSSKGFVLIFALSLSFVAYGYYSQIQFREAMYKEIELRIVEPAVILIEKKITSQVNTQINDSKLGNISSIGLGNLFGGDLLKDLQVGENIKVDLSGESDDVVEITNLDETIRPLLNEQVRNIIQPYEKYIPIFFSLSFYFFISLTFTISLFFLPLFSNLIIKVLTSTGFLKIETETVEVERLKV